MAQLSYGSDQVMESMMEAANILDEEARAYYRVIVFGRGRRQQLVKSEGRFSMAFRMEGEMNQLCYRVWKELIPDAFRRYELIGRSLAGLELDYFSHFRYVPEALRMKCDGSVLPGIVMDWIEGKTLDLFLKEEWRGLSPSERIAFIRAFYRMGFLLRQHGIAHGDLSCLNILVTPERELRLVDYDSLYVREMGRDFLQTTGGAPAFQHPERLARANSLLASPEDDNFSQYVIALSLWMAFFDPEVVAHYDETCLLFLPGDLSGSSADERLERLRASEGWRRAQEWVPRFGHLSLLLRGLESVKRPLSEVPSLFRFVSGEILSSPRFYELLAEQRPPSTRWRAAYCTACGQPFASDLFDFCTACGCKRFDYLSD